MRVDTSGPRPVINDEKGHLVAVMVNGPHADDMAPSQRADESEYLEARRKAREVLRGIHA